MVTVLPINAALGTLLIGAGYLIFKWKIIKIISASSPNHRRPFNNYDFNYPAHSFRLFLFLVPSLPSVAASFGLRSTPCAKRELGTSCRVELSFGCGARQRQASEC